MASVLTPVAPKGSILRARRGGWWQAVPRSSKHAEFRATSGRTLVDVGPYLVASGMTLHEMDQFGAILTSVGLSP